MVGYNDTHQLPHDTKRLTFGFTFKAAHAEEVQRCFVHPHSIIGSRCNQ